MGHPQTGGFNAGMPDAPLLPGPRHGWLGRVLDGCAGWPWIGPACARAQRVRRKRWRAAMDEWAPLAARIREHAAGRSFAAAWDDWWELPPLAMDVSPLPGAPRDPRVRCSVVINTVDRAQELAITLADLRAHWQPQRDELIVVLGPDSAASREIIRRSGLACQEVDCAERNLAVSRNGGLAAATGEYIAFLDDDASPCGGWLDALLEPLEAHPSAGSCAGFALDGAGRRFLTRYVVSDLLGRSTWWDEAEQAQAHLAQDPHAFPTATGCTMAFRRDFLREQGGFDPLYAYFLEETDMVLRLQRAGHRCLMAPGSVVRHRQGANAVRSPAASLASRQVVVMSQLHYIRKFGKAAHTREEILACVWRRVLSDLERMAWEHPTRAAGMQEAYLTSLCHGLHAQAP